MLKDGPERKFNAFYKTFFNGQLFGDNCKARIIEEDALNKQPLDYSIWQSLFNSYRSVSKLFKPPRRCWTTVPTSKPKPWCQRVPRNRTYRASKNYKNGRNPSYYLIKKKGYQNQLCINESL